MRHILLRHKLLFYQSRGRRPVTSFGKDLGRDSVVVTSWTVRRSKPITGEIFFTRPDRHRTVFNKNFIFDFFRKYVEKVQISLISAKNNGYFTWRSFHICDNIAHEFFSEWETLQIKALYKIKIHFSYSVTVFWKSWCLWENVGKIMMEPERPQTTIWQRVAWWISKATRVEAHARAPTHTHTHNTYCFSTATTVSCTRLSATLYAHFLYCWQL